MSRVYKLNHLLRYLIIERIIELNSVDSTKKNFIFQHKKVTQPSISNWRNAYFKNLHFFASIRLNLQKRFYHMADMGITPVFKINTDHMKKIKSADVKPISLLLVFFFSYISLIYQERKGNDHLPDLLWIIYTLTQI